MNNTIKKIFTTILYIAATVCLTACMGADGKVYGKDKVMQFVKEKCPDEKFELVSVEQIASRPDNYEYTFKSKERDLTFKANSYLAPVTIDATTTGFYQRALSCDYSVVVYSMYRDAARRVFGRYPQYEPDHGWFNIGCYADIDAAANMLLEADQVIMPELQYNSAETIKSIGMSSVHFVHYPDRQRKEEHSTWTNLCDVGINTTLTYDGVYKKISDIYLQMIVDKKITDDTVPQERLQDMHRSRISSIWLDGEEMLYDTDRTQFSDWGHTTDNYRYIWYSYDKGCYMIPCDTGICFKTSSVPLVINEYVQKMGGTYTTQTKETKKGYDVTSQWTVYGQKWTMSASYISKDNRIKNVTVKCNGKKIPLHYITSRDDYAVGATFTIGLPVEEFAGLLGLDYIIDEQAGRIDFYS